MNKQARNTEGVEPQGDGILGPSPNTRPVGKFLKKGKKEERLWHLYSPELANELNPKRPDIAAALLHFTIYTWQASNRLNKRSEAFRSIRQLEQELSYLGRTAVSEAIARLEATKVLEVDRTKDRLYFKIPPHVVKKYKYGTFRKSGMHWLPVKYAKSHGIVEALILANMSWMMMHFKEAPATDAEGRFYYNLTPSHLAKYIPKGSRAIKAALDKLSGIIIEHPTKKWHFRYVPKADSELPKADSKCPIPDSGIPKADSNEVSNARELASIMAQEAIGGAVDSKIVGKEDVNVVCKDHLTRLPAQPSASSGCRVEVSSKLSSAGIKLMQLVNESMRESVKLIPLETLVKSGEEVLLSDAGNGEFDADELPYEWIPRNKDGNVLSGDGYVDDVIDDLKAGWNLSGFPYTNVDVEKLRTLLNENRFLTHEQVDELFADLDCNTLCIGPGNDLCVADSIPVDGNEWNTWYFHGKVKSLGAFIKYLPQLLREKIFKTRYEDGEIEIEEENPGIHKHFIFLYANLCPDSEDLLHLRHNPIDDL